MIGVGALVSASFAADGAWTSTTGGNWTDTTKWSGGVVADGSGFTAYFTSNIPADALVSLNGDRSIGNLVFSDNGASGSAWTLANNTLTLAGGTPTITTTTRAAIGSTIAGTSGFTKAGAESLTLTTRSSYTGGTTVNGGTLVINAPNAGNSAIGTGTLTIGSAGRVEAYVNSFGWNWETPVVINGGTLRQMQYDSHLNTVTMTGGTLSGEPGTTFYLRNNSVVVNASSATSTISVPTLNVWAGTDFNVADGAAATDLLISSSNEVQGGGFLTKSGAGTMLLNAMSTYAGATTVNGGTLAVDGNQVANRLANNSAVTINNSGTFEIRGLNALPGGGNAVDFTVNSGGTLRVISGGSAAIGTNGTSHAHVRNLTLAGGTVSLAYSGGGAAYDSESFQLNGDVTVSGTAASVIQSTTTSTFSGIALKNTRTFTVNDVAPGTDLTVSAELQNADAGVSGLLKTGAGTLWLSGANTYTGDTVVYAGSLKVSGNSIADTGKLVIVGGKVEATGIEVVDTLFFGANQQASGTWGATGSGATHIDDTCFAGTAGVVQVTAGPAGSPTIVSEVRTLANGKKALYVDDKPFQVYGGQMRVDNWRHYAGYTEAQMSALNIFSWAKGLNINCVQVPILWGECETARNSFDWTHLDWAISECERNGLKMEVLWFGTDVCGRGDYRTLPAYVTSDSVTYPKMLKSDGTMVNEGEWFGGSQLYTVCKEYDSTTGAERNAISSLLRHLQAQDTNHVVIGMQVDNEPSIIWQDNQTDRCHCAKCNALYAAGNYANATTFCKERLAVWLNKLANAVKQSPYRVWTRINYTSGVPDEDFAVTRQYSSNNLDFVGYDTYNFGQTDRYDFLRGTCSVSGNLPFVAEEPATQDGTCRQKCIDTFKVNGGGCAFYRVEGDSTNSTDNLINPDGSDARPWTDEVRQTFGMLGKVMRQIAVLKYDNSTDIQYFNAADPTQNYFWGIPTDITTKPTATTVNNQTRTLNGMSLKYSTSNSGIGIAFADGNNLVLTSAKAGSFTVPGSGVFENGYYDTNGNWVATSLHAATDNGNGTMTINLSPGTPYEVVKFFSSVPSIVLTSPTNNQPFVVPASIPLSANVTANGHTINGVNYYSNNLALVGTSSVGPGYSATCSLPAGNYNLTAVALYDGIYSVTSAPVAIQVSPQTATWLNVGGGLWSTAGNWSNNIPANGSGVNADFSGLTLPADAPVTVDGNWTVGGMTFGDVGGRYGWNIAPGSGGVLTLNNGTNAPTIAVTSQTTTMNATLAGTSGMTKSGTGTLTLNAQNSYTGGTTVDGGTLAADGNQVANRLANNSAVTINNSGTFEIRGLNALPSGGNAVDFTVNSGGTLRVISGGSAAIGPAGTSHAHVRNLTLAGGTVSLAYSGGGTAFHGESFQLNGDVTVSGSSASLLESTTTAAQSGVALNGNRTFTVNDVAPGADLTVSAQLENAEFGDNGLVKMGAGTMLLAGTNTYTGATTVSAGRLVVAHPLALPPGSKTVAAGAAFGVRAANFSTAQLDALIAAVGWHAGGNSQLVLDTGGGTVVVPSNLAGNFKILAAGGGTLNLTGGIAPARVTAVEGTTVIYGVIPPQLPVSGFSFVGGAPTFQVPNTVLGYQYQLVCKTNLTEAIWTPVGTAQNGTGGTLTFTDPTSPLPGQRFYRLQAQ